MSDQSKKMQEARSLLEEADLVVITGAGISKESGIPTFRGKEGYWKKHAPEELATPEAFARNPELVHEWYAHRRKVCAQANPNAAHYAARDLEQKAVACGKDFLLITQNVDGLHRRAGSQNMLEIHGNIYRARCTTCKYQIDNNENPTQEILLKCPECSGFVRPDIVWFGEGYDPQVLAQAHKALEHCSVVITVGTSGVVPIPVHLSQLALSCGAKLIDINPNISALSHMAHIYLEGSAATLLPDLIVSKQRR